MMPLTPPMADPTTTTIATITRLVKKIVSDNPSNNQSRCNDWNPDGILPDDNRNEFYNATTYNLVICNKFNPDRILTVDEDHEVSSIIYDSNDNNYGPATFQLMPDNKDYDT